MKATTDRIRALNDELRRNLPDGHAVMIAGIAATPMCCRLAW